MLWERCVVHYFYSAFCILDSESNNLLSYHLVLHCADCFSLCYRLAFVWQLLYFSMEYDMFNKTLYNQWILKVTYLLSIVVTGYLLRKLC